MVAAVDTNTPDNQADGGQNNGRIGQPEAHLWRFLVVVALGKFDYDPVTQTTGAQNLRDKSTDDEAKV